MASKNKEQYIRTSISEYRKTHTGFKDMIVEYDPPLYLNGYQRFEGNYISCSPCVRSKEPVGRFQKVSGGFGSCFACNGSSIFGIYYQTIEDVINDNPITMQDTEISTCTKEFPAYVWMKK